MVSKNIYFTKYSNDKFEILNKYKVFITKEQVEEALRLPDAAVKKSKYFYYRRDGLTVVVKKEGRTSKIVTFYPTK